MRAKLGPATAARPPFCLEHHVVCRRRLCIGPVLTDGSSSSAATRLSAPMIPSFWVEEGRYGAAPGA